MRCSTSRRTRPTAPCCSSSTTSTGSVRPTRPTSRTPVRSTRSSANSSADRFRSTYARSGRVAQGAGRPDGYREPSLVITFEHASVTYPGGVQALKDVSLDLGAGEFVVIVGLSGAGKSTLIRAVNGLVPLTSGSCTVGGRVVDASDKKGIRALRAEVGMIFQTHNLVKRTTVLNNVLMGRLHRTPVWRTLVGAYTKGDVELAMRALERVEIVEKAYVRASNLSGGQQQRVGIARALAQEPEVV